MVKSKKGGSSEAARDHASIALASGFLAVPVSMAQAKTSKKADEVTHWVYVRKHVSSGASSSVASTSKLTEAAQLPAERTLFMANLPVDTTESHLRDIFAKAGNISSIRFRRSASADEEDEHDRAAEEDEELTPSRTLAPRSATPKPLNNPGSFRVPLPEGVLGNVVKFVSKEGAVVSRLGDPSLRSYVGVTWSPAAAETAKSAAAVPSTGSTRAARRSAATPSTRASCHATR